jgi:hypothetical protein
MLINGCPKLQIRQVGENAKASKQQKVSCQKLLHKILKKKSYRLSITIAHAKQHAVVLLREKACKTM